MSTPVILYSGFYAGGTPTVLSANPFDVAQDLSTGNLWQYTGGAWVAPSWQTSITFWLGAGETVCERLNAADTRIPDTIHVYYGTDELVPADLALSADDIAVHHDIGNYNLKVNVLRRDVTTDTMVEVPFPEGYIISTDDGDWTILKNFTRCVGFDYAMVSLAWTTTADGQGPQSVDYVTSGGVEEMISAAIGSGGGVSGALISGAEFITSIDDYQLSYTSGGGFSFVQLPEQEGPDPKIAVSFRSGIVSIATDAQDEVSPTSVNISMSGGQLTEYTRDGSITLQNTYPVFNYETGERRVVSNTFRLSDNSIIMGCNDPDLGEWYASFDTQNITLSVNGTVLLVDFDSVRINTSLYLSSSLVLQDDFSNATLEASGGAVTLNSEAIATQPWVSNYVSSHGGSASGAIIENQPFTTTVGGYTVSLTSGGGLLVSSGGVALQVSNGGIVASADNGDEDAPTYAVLSITSGVILAHTLENTDHQNAECNFALVSGAIDVSGANGESVMMSGGVVNLHLEEANDEYRQDIILDTNGVTISANGADRRILIEKSGGGTIEAGEHGVSINSRPVLTELATSTDTTTTSAYLDVLSGGTSYIYTQPLTALEVGSITSNARAEFDFTASSDFRFLVPASAKCMGVDSFTSGSHYLILVDGARVVTNEYTTGA